MFSGIMMTALYKTLNGHLGLAGWRWVLFVPAHITEADDASQLFIILGIITMPVALFGFILFPDLPETCKAFWLTEEEKELAITRLPPRPPNSAGGRLGWGLIRRVFFRPELYVVFDTMLTYVSS